MNTTELQKAFKLMNFDISAPDMHVCNQPLILSPVLCLNDALIKVLFNYLDKNGDKYVNYMEFLEWVEDPNYSKVSHANECNAATTTTITATLVTASIIAPQTPNIS